MKKLVFGVAAAGLGALMVGCSTVDPLLVEQTARDREEFVAEVERPLPEGGQFKIAIVSKTEEVSAALKDPKTGKLDQKKVAFLMQSESGREMMKNYAKERDLLKHVKTQADVTLTECFFNLGWFETVDRKNGVALAKEAMLSGGDEGEAAIPTAAQYVLVADSRLAYMAGSGRTKDAGKATGVLVTTDFQLIELATKQPLLAQKAEHAVGDVKGTDQMKDAIQKACALNARQFARYVAAKWLPEVKVVQTRGSGRYAQVAMGKNYQLEPEIRVDFGSISKETVGGEDKYNFDVIAHGKVLSADQKRAWVEVENYGRVGVKKGHCVRLSEEVAAE